MVRLRPLRLLQRRHSRSILPPGRRRRQRNGIRGRALPRQPRSELRRLRRRLPDAPRGRDDHRLPRRQVREEVGPGSGPISDGLPHLPHGMPSHLRASGELEHGPAGGVQAGAGDERGGTIAGELDIYGGDEAEGALGLLRRLGHDGGERGHAPGQPLRRPNPHSPHARSARLVGMADTVPLGHRECIRGGIPPLQGRGAPSKCRGVRHRQWGGRREGKC
mmetsp:Transcript_46897/g.99623  ORF Transcript_46897/g.99623 Transcript_46897/m.99623 type:complete len:220 (-) Transcript_46897:1144-1803(-)